MSQQTADNIKKIKATLPCGVELVAVSKFHPEEVIKEAYRAGQRIFGESRVQELLAKKDLLPADIEWHFIGHLQTNKVKNIVPFITLIHSGDSERILDEINRCAEKIGRKVRVLLQLHVAEEETKTGFTPEELYEYMSHEKWRTLNHITISGVMGMASFVENEEQIRKEFTEIRAVFDNLKKQYFPNDDGFAICSMGMSHDYRIAVECGSTMVRIGTTIFGKREY